MRQKALAIFIAIFALVSSNAKSFVLIAKGAEASRDGGEKRDSGGTGI